LFCLCDDLSSNYIYATGGNNLPPLLPKPPLLPESPNHIGQKLPPLPQVLSEHAQPRDWLTRLCANQLLKVNSGETNLPIFNPRHDFDCRIGPELQPEFLRRFQNSGNTDYVIKNGKLMYPNTGGVPARMNQSIFDSIRVGG
jgi:hypothetical protein